MESQILKTNERISHPNEQTQRVCTICGSDQSEEIYPSKLPPLITSDELHSQYDLSGKKPWWRYRVVKCNSCGHCYANPTFRPVLLENSYVIQKHDNEFGLNEEQIHLTFQGYVDLISPHLKGKSKRTHLDVGCDTGKFLEVAQSLNFEKYIGIEPSQESVAKIKTRPNTEVINGLFEPQLFRNEAIDLVTLIHVLDHIAEPKKFLGSIGSILSEGGLIFIVVHNIQSFIAKISRSSWHPFNLIHYDYYSRKSLRELFRLCGFEVLSVQGTKNIMGFEQVLIRAPYLGSGMRGALKSAAKIPPLNKLKLKLPLGNLCLIARKARSQ